MPDCDVLNAQDNGHNACHCCLYMCSTFTRVANLHLTSAQRADNYTSNFCSTISQRADIYTCNFCSTITRRADNYTCKFCSTISQRADNYTCNFCSTISLYINLLTHDTGHSALNCPSLYIYVLTHDTGHSALYCPSLPDSLMYILISRPHPALVVLSCIFSSLFATKDVDGRGNFSYIIGSHLSDYRPIKFVTGRFITDATVI